MRTPLLSAALAACLALATTPALADPAADVVDAFGDGAPADRQISATNSLELSAGQDSGRISLSLGWGDLTVTASAPGNDDESDADLATLGGFANASTLEVQYTFLSTPDIDRQMSARAEAICAELNILRATPRGQCSSTPMRAASRKGEDSACAQHATPAACRTRWRALYREYLRETHIGSTLFGATAKVGTQEFKFYDPTSLDQMTISRSPWSVTAFVAGQPFEGDPTFFTLSGEYAEDYSAADSLVVCPAGPPPLTCVNGPIGGPGAADRKVVRFEARRAWDFDGEGRNFAIAAMISYDFEADVTGVDVPVYLFEDGKGGLSGGFRLGWRDDTDDLTFGVFIGKSFSSWGP